MNDQLTALLKELYSEPLLLLRLRLGDGARATPSDTIIDIPAAAAPAPAAEPFWTRVKRKIRTAWAWVRRRWRGESGEAELIPLVPGAQAPDPAAGVGAPPPQTPAAPATTPGISPLVLLTFDVNASLPMRLFVLFYNALGEKKNAEAQQYRTDLIKKIRCLGLFFKQAITAIKPRVSENQNNFKIILGQLYKTDKNKCIQLLLFIKNLQDLKRFVESAAVNQEFLQHNQLFQALSALLNTDLTSAILGAAQEFMEEIQLPEIERSDAPALQEKVEALNKVLKEIGERGEYSEADYKYQDKVQFDAPSAASSTLISAVFFHREQFENDLKTLVTQFTSLVIFLKTHPACGGFQLLSIVEYFGREIAKFLNEDFWNERANRLGISFPQECRESLRQCALFMAAGICQLLRDCYGGNPANLKAIGESLGFLLSFRRKFTEAFWAKSIAICLGIALFAGAGAGLSYRFANTNYADMRSTLLPLEIALGPDRFETLIRVFNEIFDSSKTLFLMFRIGWIGTFILPLMQTFWWRYSTIDRELKESPEGKIWEMGQNPWRVFLDFSNAVGASAPFVRIAQACAAFAQGEMRETEMRGILSSGETQPAAGAAQDRFPLPSSVRNLAVPAAAALSPPSAAARPAPIPVAVPPPPPPARADTGAAPRAAALSPLPAAARSAPMRATVLPQRPLARAATGAAPRAAALSPPPAAARSASQVTSPQAFRDPGHLSQRDAADTTDAAARRARLASLSPRGSSLRSAAGSPRDVLGSALRLDRASSGVDASTNAEAVAAAAGVGGRQSPTPVPAPPLLSLARADTGAAPRAAWLLGTTPARAVTVGLFPSAGGGQTGTGQVRRAASLSPPGPEAVEAELARPVSVARTPLPPLNLREREAAKERVDFSRRVRLQSRDHQQAAVPSLGSNEMVGDGAVAIRSAATTAELRAAVGLPVHLSAPPTRRRGDALRGLVPMLPADVTDAERLENSLNTAGVPRADSAEQVGGEVPALPPPGVPMEGAAAAAAAPPPSARSPARKAAQSNQAISLVDVRVLFRYDSVAPGSAPQSPAKRDKAEPRRSLDGLPSERSLV